MKKKLHITILLLLVIGTLFGVLLAIFTPFGTGFDEERHHLPRVFDISVFNMLPNTTVDNQTAYFSEFHTLSFWRRFFRDEGFEMFKPETFLVRGNYGGMSIGAINSVYPPLMFFPQAAVAGIAWRFFDWPIIPVTIVMRIVGLLLFLAGCAVTLKLLPISKWSFLVLALTPTALYQASTINADGYSFAVGFIFMALVLNAALRPQVKLTCGYWLALILAVIGLGLGKPATVFLLPMLLMLPRRVFSSRAQLITLWLVSIAAFIFQFAWLYLGFQNTRFGSEIFTDTALSITSQLGTYLTAFARSFILYKTQLFSSMLAGYGNWFGKVPALTYVFLIAALLLSLLMDKKHPQLTWKMRLFMLGLMLLNWAGTLFLLTSGKFSQGSTDTFLIIQGRYLLPTLPLLFFALSGLLSLNDKTTRLFQRLIPAASVLALIVFFWGLYAYFYTSCGPYLFTGQNCELPAYHNMELDEPAEILLRENTLLEQDFSNTCRNLTEVQVLIGDKEIDASGQLRLSLVDASGAVILSQTYHADDLSPLQRLSLSVPQGQQLQPGAFTIRLEPIDLKGYVGFAIRYPDRYPGELREDGDPVDADLVFFYFCAPAGPFSY